MSSTKAPLPPFQTDIGPDRGVCPTGGGTGTPFLTGIGPDRGECTAGKGIKHPQYRAVPPEGRVDALTTHADTEGLQAYQGV